MTEYQYAFQQPGRYGRGWYIVALSQELAAGEIKALHFFDRDLVLYRGEAGRAAVLDAHCPHLGAHLAGNGAKVIRDTLRCPFHGWQFDGDGSCVHIPYAKRIPERANNALTGWPLSEQNGFIALWYDPDGASEPDWQLPAISAWGDSGCGDWRFKRRLVNTQGHEIVENIVDSGHFAFVHGGRVETFDISFEAHTVTQYSVVCPDPKASFIVPPDLPFNLAELRGDEPEGRHEGHATYHGPAVMYFHTRQSEAEFSYDAWWLNYFTPVNARQVELTSAVLIAPAGEQPLPAEFIAMYPEVAWAAFSQDIEVWESKIYRPDPILCDGDGPITKLRKWYDQFFQPAPQPLTVR